MYENCVNSSLIIFPVFLWPTLDFLVSRGVTHNFQLLFPTIDHPSCSSTCYWGNTVFENDRRSRIQHCERSELRLHLNEQKLIKNGEVHPSLSLSIESIKFVHNYLYPLNQWSSSIIIFVLQINVAKWDFLGNF